MVFVFYFQCLIIKLARLFSDLETKLEQRYEEPKKLWSDARSEFSSTWALSDVLTRIAEL